MANTGYNPFETEIGIANVSTLGVAWTYRAGSAWATTALANGVVYAAGTTHQFPVSTRLSAVDSTTGSVIWAKRIPRAAATTSGPAYDQGSLYLGTDDYLFRCFDARTGKQRWGKFLGGTPGNAVPAAGVVYVAKNSGTVYAFDARTGDELWESENYGLLYGTPALSDGVLYIGTGGLDNGLHALDAATGKELWYFDPGSGGLNYSPAVSGALVYETSADTMKLYAVNAATGTLVWKRSLGDPGSASSPAVANGIVYATGNGVVQAFNALDGTPIWASPLATSAGAPIVANGVLYDRGGFDETLHALDADTGRTLWSYTAGGDFADPIVANGMLYAGSADDNLYAFGLSS